MPSTQSPHDIDDRYRRLYETMRDAFVSVTMDGRLEEFNRVYQEMLGYDAEELRHLTYVDLTPAKWHEFEARIVRDQILVRGYSEVYQKEYRRKDGTILPVELLTVLVRDNQGIPTGMWAIVRDISARLQAEEQYQTLFREMLNGFALHEILLDSQGQPTNYRFLAVNPAFERLTGLRAEQVIGQTVLDLMPETEPHWIETFGRVTLTGEPAMFESYAAALGKYFQVTAFRPAPGRFACIFADVTEQKRTMELLRDSEAHIRAISDNLVNGMIYQVVVRDTSTRHFTYLSDSVRRFYGVSPQEVMADPDLIYGRIHPDDIGRLLQEEQRSISTLSTFKCEARLLTPDGGIRWSYFVSSPKVLPDGTSCWDGIEMDITDYKRAEQEKDSLQAQLYQAQKLESVGRLAGGVAHDFNNMLSVILGYAEMLLGEIPPEDAKYDKVSEILQAARRSGDLTRQLLAFARRQAVTPVVLDLNETVTSMLKMIRRLIGEDIDLAWQPGHGVGKVRIDPSQVDQILANLCVNARDAIDGHGTITIATADCQIEAHSPATPELPPGRYVQLTIQDNGCGMEPEIMAAIFEPFFTTKALGHGTGLGLATVYGIVHQNNGVIRVESEPGKGTTFTILLPVHEGGAEDAHKPAAPETAPAGRMETVLLVEDEWAILSMTRTMLESLGYLVLPAATPKEAIRLAEAALGPIDLLLTDVVMPEMNGRELSMRIQATQPTIRCLFMSGYTADVLLQHDIGLQGTLLSKPFDRQTLATAVRTALHGA